MLSANRSRISDKVLVTLQYAEKYTTTSVLYDDYSDLVPMIFFSPRIIISRHSVHDAIDRHIFATCHQIRESLSTKQHLDAFISNAHSSPFKVYLQAMNPSSPILRAA